MDVIEDLVRSAHRHGFRRILVLNGHGGNDPARVRLFEVLTDLPDLRIAWYAWWQSHSAEALAQKYELRPGHAGWMEAFPFTRVADLPEEHKIPPRVPGLLGATEARQVYGDGMFGGAYQADPAVMDELFSELLIDVVNLLKFE
jgi:creatinine amidohydrolase